VFLSKKGKLKKFIRKEKVILLSAVKEDLNGGRGRGIIDGKESAAPRTAESLETTLKKLASEFKSLGGKSQKRKAAGHSQGEGKKR